MPGLPWLRRALALLAAVSFAGWGACVRAEGVSGSAAERDGFAERDRWLAGLAAVDAGAVRLLAPPGLAAELRPLAEELARSIEAMARRVPVVLERPVVLAVEEDYPSMVRHTGRIGRAVPSDPFWDSLPADRAPDLHLVVHPGTAWWRS